VIGVVAVAVVLVPAAWGFSWLAGLAATGHQYRVTVARHRPYDYFLVANVVVAAVAVGPVVLAGLASGRRRETAIVSLPAAWAVVVGAALALVVADVSGMAKAEVERIWQPFFPWLAFAVLALPTPRFDRARLALQAGLAIGLTVSLWTLW